MASTKVLQLEDKVAKLQEYGSIGYRAMDDPFFVANNTVIFKPFVRLGVYRYDDESLCHKSNRVRCNIPKCNEEFDTIFAYENHYNSLHRFLCAQCSKNLPSAHLLDLHLSEKHDSFFAVQAERKPMFRCYLEECLKLSQTPSERRDHCITEHKFPHDFRFDCYGHTKKSNSNNNNNNKVESKKSNQKSANPKSSSSTTVLQPPKLVSVTTHDEDIELEDKSILLTAQRKHFTNFSFGHKKSKAFRSNAPAHSYVKQLTAKSETNKPPSGGGGGLDNANLVDDLMESLPQ
ncbi:protein lethal(2)k10201 [Sitodiplosis mosellana]|uniref:protein lethal(2)k10201 n=1 Tax=Sitodiplosis mosellana TaxID=263140 RepID=UPI0024451546|nr:protein lethal(2)k10201 [Sitodiplosis mosellana]